MLEGFVIVTIDHTIGEEKTGATDGNTNVGTTEKKCDILPAIGQHDTCDIASGEMTVCEEGGDAVRASV